MSIGSVQYVIQCKPRTDGGAASAPCGTDASGTAYQPVMVQAYVADPGAASYFDAMSEPFDYSQGMAFFSTACSFALLAWFVARNAGAVLAVIRRG
jgi:hypothetical protein